MLEAQAIPYQLLALGEDWALLTCPELVARAQVELTDYAAEAVLKRPAAPTFWPFPGAGYGAIGYALILLLVAYAAGAHLFGADWFAAGAVDASPAARHEWWRSLTALTLHIGPEHLFGNLLFGIVAGVLCGRLVGPGIAWLSALLAGAAANGLETWIAPVDHRAVGASTAVFAALGLLAGLAWRQRWPSRERRLYPHCTAHRGRLPVDLPRVRRGACRRTRPFARIRAGGRARLDLCRAARAAQPRHPSPVRSRRARSCHGCEAWWLALSH